MGWDIVNVKGKIFPGREVYETIKGFRQFGGRVLLL